MQLAVSKQPNQINPYPRKLEEAFTIQHRHEGFTCHPYERKSKND